MPIELPKEVQADAIESLERWCRENLDEPVGGLRVRALLAYFVEEIAPAVYNQAVLDVQERLQSRIAELDLEVREEPFQYWRRRDRPPPKRR